MLPQSTRPLLSSPSASQRLQCWHGLALQKTSIPSANGAACSMRTAVLPCSRQGQCSRGQCQAASAAKQNSSPHHRNSRSPTFDISRTWDGLVGWEVLLQRNGFKLGTVQEVCGRRPFGTLPLLNLVHRCFCCCCHHSLCYRLHLHLSENFFVSTTPCGSIIYILKA